MPTSKLVKLANNVLPFLLFYSLNVKKIFLLGHFSASPKSNKYWIWIYRVVRRLLLPRMDVCFYLPFCWRKCRVTVLHSSELHKTMRQAVWDLFESNMHDLYWPFCLTCNQSSYMLLQLPKLSNFWWLGPKDKKERTFQFKVAVYFSSSDRSHNNPSSGIFHVSFWERRRWGCAILVTVYKKKLFSLNGDVSFQIYSYELQVAATARGLGLGKKLMNDLMTLSRAFNMKKILLTVFKGLYPSFLARIASGHRIEWNFVVNTSAMQFYKHIGCVVIVC